MLPKLPRIVRAPEFKGLGPWHNSQPLTLKELQGKVVLVDFWTYSCINCIRTLPHIQGYWEKFGPSSLSLGGRANHSAPSSWSRGERGSKESSFVVIGVHSPEFVFEKSEKNVTESIQRYGLMYPIAQDNDFATWQAFANHYWPAKYLIDAEGYIRYTHFGEGGYEETEEAIRSLLTEIGVNMEGKGGVTPSPSTSLRTGSIEGAKGDAAGYRELTPETYLGSRSWPAFAEATHSTGSGRAAGKPAIPDDDIHQYVPSAELPLHHYTLSGEWQLLEGERQVLRSPEGEIRMRFLGGEINLVLGLEEGASPVTADVLLDGKSLQSFTIDHHDLYHLFKGAYGEHEIQLLLHGKGVEGYAFTFGT